MDNQDFIDKFLGVVGNIAQRISREDIDRLIGVALRPSSGPVFFDRDGVTNRLVSRDGRSVPPRYFDQFEIFPEVTGTGEILRRARFGVVAAMNQPDV